MVNLLRIHLRESYATGKPAPRQGNRSAAAAPSNIYRCSPGGPNDYVFIHCATVDMWKALTRIVGRPEMADDPRYRDFPFAPLTGAVFPFLAVSVLRRFYPHLRRAKAAEFWRIPLRLAPRFR